MPLSISAEERGVSEVLGAILAMAVIVTVAGLIYLRFQPIFQENIDELKMDSIREEMTETREVMERVANGLEVKSWKKISLYGGRIYIDYDYITLDGKRMKIGSLNLAKNSKIVSAGSGVFEIDTATNAKKILRLPDISKTSDRIYLNLINVTGSGSAGGEELYLAFKEINSTVLSVSDVKIHSRFCDEWSKALTLSGVENLNRCPDYVEITGNISVRIYTVEVII